MTQYKYYLADNGLGVPHEIYRGPLTYEKFFDSGLERAKKDGSWSAHTSEMRWLMNLWQTGDFDPKQDEISEAQALSQLDAWRQSGTWPGRE